MAKLYSTPAELIALRSICQKNNMEVSGWMLAHIDETYFHTEAAKEGYEAILTHMRSSGQVPAWKLLTENVSLGEDAREILREASAFAKNKVEAQEVIDRLTNFRKTRIAYYMCKDVLKTLEGDKIDPDSVADMIGTQLTAMQTNKSIEDCLFHTGKDGNADELVKSIIYDEQGDDFIPIGLKTFDSVNGGMPRGGLVTLGGASGSGKCIGPDSLVRLAAFHVELENGDVLTVRHDRQIVVLDSRTQTEVTCLAKDLDVEAHLFLRLVEI